MNILLKPYRGSVFDKNKVFELDNGDNIFFKFKEKLDKVGIKINTIDLESKEKVDRIVFCDVPFFWEIKNWLILIFNKQKSILLCFESPIINPFNHRRFFYKFFRLIYTWNDKFIDNKKVRKFYIPILNSYLNYKEVPFKEKKLICMMNSNISVPYPLLLLSPSKKILYPERIKAINFFEKTIPKEFDLYGRGWNAPMKFSLKEKLFGYPIHTSYKGSVPRNLKAKLDVISKYKFTICFENCVVPGYIQKIIDCFKAHTVPIYLGATNIEKYFPKDCFIDFREFRDYETLYDFIIKMKEKEYIKYIKKGKKFLKSKEFQKNWSEVAFLSIFLDAIS